MCRPKSAIFAIADGMGGHAAGEVAAKMALDEVCAHLTSPDARDIIATYARDPEIEHRRAIFALLSEAMSAANDAVRAEAEDDPDKQGMGTTLDVVLLVRDRAFFAHVGDSRAYLVRPTATLQLTHDHAAFDSLRTSGKRAQTKRFNRSPLTNSIGHRKRLTVDTLFVDLASGDRIMLCTDGVFNALDDELPLSRACRRGGAEDIVDTLIRQANAAGNRDDATAIAIVVGRRFASRKGDAGPRARDIATISSSPLLVDLPPADVLATLAAGVEVELAEDAEIPRAVAGDRVAYVILDGLVELPNGRKLGASGLLMAESLLDMPLRGKRPTVAQQARLLRIRHDDFNEVCAHDAQLAAELYKRIARHLAHSR